MIKSTILAASWLAGFHLAMISPFAISSYGGKSRDVNLLSDVRHSAVPEPGFAQRRICDSEKIQEVQAPASHTAGSVLINCDLHLTIGGRAVTKQLLFEGRPSSGVTVNCNGATLNAGTGRIVEIRSRRYRRSFDVKRDSVTGTWTWERPTNITIRNCNMIGAVRIWGMSETGEGKESTIGQINYLRESSRTGEHVNRVRNNAPTNIVFDHVVISSIDRIPLYISPGVTNFQLLDSEIKGSSSAVAIYLDAESSGNTFRNNRIYTTTTRELIAIDGSSNNVFINNWLSSLSKGGIYLYRNCGENGVSRHSTPSHNVIVNNFFVYHDYSGFNPAVYLGARSGNRGYCDEDHSRYGSGISDLDHAQFNVVMQNQIQQRSVDLMIRTANLANSLPRDSWIRANSPNYVRYNETVATRKIRRAGCYVAEEKRFLLDAESFRVVKGFRGNSTTRLYSCQDGILTRTNDAR